MMNDYDGGLQAHLVVILIKVLYMFTAKYSLVTMSTVYVTRIQFMYLQSTVYVSRVQFKSQEHSLCP